MELYSENNNDTAQQEGTTLFWVNNFVEYVPAENSEHKIMGT